MKLCALDLEMNQPSGNIIQIGICVLDTETGEITGKKRIYVHPNEPLQEYIINLTGITEANLANEGMSLLDAYNEMIEHKKEHEYFHNPITWGGGDSMQLRSQLTFDYPHEIDVTTKWIFGRGWFDLKKTYQMLQIANGGKVQGGLARSMGKFGLKFEGRKHDALDDAINTARLYYAIQQRFFHGTKREGNAPFTRSSSIKNTNGNASDKEK